MVITQGTDAGKEFEIDGAKTYTIGRALDNDIVLTDIAVSRKHFDLRYEGGAWVIVDRGSGNGTVVNGNLEDHPFMLANGDAIEIGNTIFRLRAASGGLAADRRNVRRRHRRGRAVDDRRQAVPEEASRRRHSRTSRRRGRRRLPPPMPLRTRPVTQPPQQFVLPAPPASTMPMPQMANRPPIVHMSAPTHLPGMSHLPSSVMNTSAPTGMPMRGPMSMPMGTPMNTPSNASMPMTPISAPMNAPTLLGAALEPQLDSTARGLGPPGPAPMPFFYPQATEIPPHSVHAMLVVQAQNKRGDGSTAPVHAAPYAGSCASPSRFAPPQLSRRAKLGLGLAGITVLATITTHRDRALGRQIEASDGRADSGEDDTKWCSGAVAPPPPPPTPVIAKQRRSAEAGGRRSAKATSKRRNRAAAGSTETRPDPDRGQS